MGGDLHIHSYIPHTLGLVLEIIASTNLIMHHANGFYHYSIKHYLIDVAMTLSPSFVHTEIAVSPEHSIEVSKPDFVLLKILTQTVVLEMGIKVSSRYARPAYTDKLGIFRGSFKWPSHKCCHTPSAMSDKCSTSRRSVMGLTAQEASLGKKLRIWLMMCQRPHYSCVFDYWLRGRSSINQPCKLC